MTRGTTLKYMVPVILLVLVIVSPMSSTLVNIPASVKAEDDKVYPEQVLLQLIEESNITVSQQVIDLLNKAASLRGEDNETANALVIEAFQLIATESARSGTHCIVLKRMALAYSNTIRVLYRAIDHLEENLRNETTIPVLEEARKHLEYASGNVSLALKTLNGNCTSTTMNNARNHLSTAREEIWAARNILDTITACRFKNVILGVLQHRLANMDRQIQVLSIRKGELESKGLTLPAMQVEKMIEILSARNQAVMQAIKEINETQNCTSLWALVTSMKMINHYIALQSNIIHHYSSRIKTIGPLEAKTLMLAHRLETANHVLGTMSSNTVGLSDDARAKLQDIQAKLQEILILYREALKDSWTGSSNPNNTIVKLLELTHDTREEINQLINELPKHGYGQTAALLRSVSKSLGEVEEIVTHASKSMEKMHHRILIAKSVSVKLQLRTIYKDLDHASMLAYRYCNNTVLSGKLEEASNHIQAALNTGNMSVVEQNLEAALNAIDEARSSLNSGCRGVSLVLTILEMEINSTLALI